MLDNIKYIVRGVISRYQLHHKDTMKLFITYVAINVPTYVMLSDKVINSLGKHMTYDSERQDIIYSLLTDIIMELHLDGIDIDRIKVNMKKIHISSTDSVMISKELRNMMVVRNIDNLMLAIYLVKISSAESV